jgi:hypothetical protein
MRARFAITLTSVACVFFALAGACIAPPIIAPAGKPVLELSEAQCAMNAERVEVDVGDGEMLRGIFVPGMPGRPLVLHFLGSQMSITSGIEFAGIVYDLDPLFEQLARNGWASLVLDYRGVGASDGTRDARHLSDDAWTAWNEAVRRAGGNPSRVYISGVSIGTLAVASLLQRGVEPGMVALAAPVRAETVARNWMAAHYGSIAAALVAPLLRKPVDIDLVAALERARCSLYVVTAAHDELLPMAERQLVAAAVRNSPEVNASCTERDLDHFDLVLDSSRVSKHGFWWPFEQAVECTAFGVALWGEAESFLDDPRMCQVPPGRAFR